MSAIGCKKGLISFLTPFFFFNSAYSTNGHIYIGVSIASSFAKPGIHSPQISYLSGDTITDDYPLSKKNASTAIFGANGGFEFTGAQGKPSIALGLGLYSNLVDYSLQGQVIETAAGDASSILYNYAYDVNSKRLMAEIQLSWTFYKLSPFLNFGLGSAWSRMNNYHEMSTNTIGFPPLPPFQTHTNTNFAYQAGFGVNMAFPGVGAKSGLPQERISLGYRYVNLGTASFGTRGADYPYTLNSGLLQTNEVYLGYTHLFDGE